MLAPDWDGAFSGGTVALNYHKTDRTSTTQGADTVVLGLDLINGLNIQTVSGLG